MDYEVDNMSINQYENADIQEVNDAARKAVEQDGGICNGVRDLTFCLPVPAHALLQRLRLSGII